MTPHQQPASLADIEFITVDEMAATMRVSKMTVYRLIHTKEVDALRIGRSFRIPVAAAIDYMKSCYVTGTRT